MAHEGFGNQQFTKIKERKVNDDPVNLIVWFPQTSKIESISISSKSSKNEVVPKIQELVPNENLVEVRLAGLIPDTTGFVGLIRKPIQERLTTILGNIKFPFKRIEELDELIDGTIVCVALSDH